MFSLVCVALVLRFLFVFRTAQLTCSHPRGLYYDLCCRLADVSLLTSMSSGREGAGFMTSPLSQVATLILSSNVGDSAVP